MELNKQSSTVLNKLTSVGQLVFFCLELNQDRHASKILSLDDFPRVLSGHPKKNSSGSRKGQNSVTF